MDHIDMYTNKWKKEWKGLVLLPSHCLYQCFSKYGLWDLGYLFFQIFLMHTGSESPQLLYLLSCCFVLGSADVRYSLIPPCRDLTVQPSLAFSSHVATVCQAPEVACPYLVTRWLTHCLHTSYILKKIFRVFFLDFRAVESKESKDPLFFFPFSVS